MFNKINNISNLDINKFKFFFIFFFVISLVLSRLFVDLLVVFGALTFLFLKIKRKEKIRSNIFFYFLIFYIYLIINSFFSTTPIASLRATLPYIRFIFFIFFFQSYFSDYKSLKFVLYSFFFIYIILFIDGIFQLNTGYNLSGNALENSERVSSFFGRHLVLGSFISKTFAIVVFLIFYLKIKYKYLAYLGTILISSLLIYISRERSALFVFLLTLFLSLFLIERKFFLKIFLIISLQFILLIFFYQQPLQRIYLHSKNQLFQDSKYFKFISERHELHYLTALRIFYKSPFIGGGAQSFRYLCDKSPYTTEDVILKNSKNKVYAQIEGYYFSSSIEYKGKISRFVSILKKEYFDKNNISNFDENQILELIKKDLNNNNSSSVIMDYFAIHSYDNLFQTKNKNFDFIKKNSLLYILYEFKNGCNTHPHNLYLQFLSELGILGTVFLVLFYSFICKSLLIRIIDFIKNGVNSNDTIIYAYYFSVFFPLIPSGNFFNNYYSILLYLPLSFILLCRHK